MGASPGRALVTGGAGLIGSHLADLLVEKNYGVTVLDSLEPQTHPQGKPAWLNSHARFVEGDVRNESDLAHALEGVDFIFHLAAFGGFTPAISKYIDANVVGTARLFEQIAGGKFRVKKVVVASSQAVYGEGAYECPKEGRKPARLRTFGGLQKKQWEPLCPDCGASLKPVVTPEEKPSEGNTPYALSKEFEERLALSYGKQLGLPVTALRFGVTYGPRQSLFNPYTGVVSIFSTRLLNGLPPLVYEDGNQLRDFVYVGDVARANLFALETGATDFEVFNVGTGKPTSVAGLARELALIYQKKIEPEVPGQFRVGDVRNILLDPAKLSRLGFTTRVPLKEGLRKFAEWMASQGPAEEYFSAAYENLKKNRIIHG